MIASAKELKEGDWFQFEYEWPWHYVYQIKDGVGGNRNPNTVGKRLVQTMLYGGHISDGEGQPNTSMIPRKLKLWIAIPNDRGVRISDNSIPKELATED